MGDAVRHISTVDQTVRIEKRETKFVIPSCRHFLSKTAFRVQKFDVSFRVSRSPFLFVVLLLGEPVLRSYVGRNVTCGACKRVTMVCTH